MKGISDGFSDHSAGEALLIVLAQIGLAPERLREILDVSSEPLIAFTADRVILAANPVGEAFFGYGRHELDGRSTDAIVPERFRQPAAPPMPETKDLMTVEIPCLRRDATEIQTTWTFGSAPGHRGPVFVMLVRDRSRVAVDQFRAVYESALDGIMLTREDLTIADANPAACRILGRSREELIQMSPSELIPPEDRWRGHDQISELRAAGAMTGEGAILRPDGSVRRAEFGAVANVSPGLHLSIFRDIEDRKRAEESQRFLDEASTILAGSLDFDETLSSVARLAVSHISDWAAVDLRGPDGSLRRVAVAHVDPTKIELAKRLRELQQPSLDDATGVGAVVRTGKPELVELVTDEMLATALAPMPEMLEVTRGLGLHSAMTVPLFVRGEVAGCISFVSAESRRRFGASDLAFAEELARRAGYAVANAMSVRELKLANESKDLFLRRAEHLQVTAMQLVRAESVGAIARVFETTESRSPMSAVGWSLYVRSGEQLQLLAATAGVQPTARLWTPIALDAKNPLADAVRSAAPVWLEDADRLLAQYPDIKSSHVRSDVRGRAALPLLAGETCIGVVGVTFPDAREFGPDERAYLIAVANLWGQALHRAQLAEAERDAIRRALDAENIATRKKDEFLAMLGHELRNPLSPIVTALQLLRMRTVENRELEVIERQVDHLVRLVDDLLDVSRITRGKIELRTRRVELGEIVMRGIETASPLLERRRQRVDVEVAPDGLPLDADPDRLGQVVANLLTNASKYSDPGKTVHIDAGRVGNLVRLRVRDEGVGIRAELLNAVFEVFFQPPQAPDRAKGGLGLGLAIVRSLVELHGGRAWATSDGPGQGSEFIVELPLATGADDQDGAKGPTPALTQVHLGGAPEAGQRILVVDDNEDAAQTIAALLSDLGHEVHTAYDGVHALEVVKTFKPDICLLDLGLPAMDGYELARQLRRSNDLRDDARLIAVTGYGQDADKQRTAEAGFDRHLVKPVTYDELLDAVRASGRHPADADPSLAHHGRSSGA